MLQLEYTYICRIYVQFELLRSNLVNRRKRTALEAVVIALQKAKLNNQIYHRSVRSVGENAQTNVYALSLSRGICNDI